MARVVGKDAGLNPDDVEAKLTPEWLNAMEWSMKHNPTTPTRIDRRFPNVNQSNNCW